MKVVAKTFNQLIKYKTLYGLTFIFIVWFFLHLVINSTIIPNPIETTITFIQLLREDLIIHMLVSLYRITVAVFISLVLGITTGLFLGMNEKYDRFVSPIIYLLYPLPKIAFLPILMILFGIGDTSKIMLITIIILFQILVTTRDSVKGISREHFLSIKSLGATNIQMYRHLVLPAVLPKLLTALRISIGTSIAVLFYAENFATSYGIGYFIMDSWTRVDYVQMFAGIIGISLLGFLIFASIDGLERKICRWTVLEKLEKTK